MTTRTITVDADDWAKFESAYLRWCAARQPAIVEAGRKALFLREVERNESSTRFCQAAATIAYANKPQPKDSPQ
jgi:hypothetical protein